MILYGRCGVIAPLILVVAIYLVKSENIGQSNNQTVAQVESEFKLLDSNCLTKIRENLIKFLKRTKKKGHTGNKRQKQDYGDDGDEDDDGDEGGAQGQGGALGILAQTTGHFTALQRAFAPQLLRTFGLLTGVVHTGLNSTGAQDVPTFIRMYGPNLLGGKRDQANDLRNQQQAIPQQQSLVQQQALAQQQYLAQQQALALQQQLQYNPVPITPPLSETGYLVQPVYPQQTQAVQRPLQHEPYQLSSQPFQSSLQSFSTPGPFQSSFANVVPSTTPTFRLSEGYRTTPRSYVKPINGHHIFPSNLINSWAPPPPKFKQPNNQQMTQAPAKLNQPFKPIRTPAPPIFRKPFNPLEASAPFVAANNLPKTSTIPPNPKTSPRSPASGFSNHILDFQPSPTPPQTSPKSPEEIKKDFAPKASLADIYKVIAEFEENFKTKIPEDIQPNNPFKSVLENIKSQGVTKKPTILFSSLPDLIKQPQSQSEPLQEALIEAHITPVPAQTPIHVPSQSEIASTEPAPVTNPSQSLPETTRPPPKRITSKPLHSTPSPISVDDTLKKLIASGKPIYWMNVFYPNGFPVITRKNKKHFYLSI